MLCWTSSIAPGEIVRLRLPGQSTWSTGECKGLVGPTSYEVKVGERSYRRNRRQLIHAGESPTQDLPSEEVPSSQGHESYNSTDKTQGPRNEIPTGAVVPTSPPALPAPRRSERLRKQPAWMTMFHPNNPTWMTRFTVKVYLYISISLLFCHFYTGGDVTNSAYLITSFDYVI